MSRSGSRAARRRPLRPAWPWWAAGTAALVTLVALSMPRAATGDTLTVCQSPTCECCGRWEDHLTAHGFRLTVHRTDAMSAVKHQQAVPGSLISCHTALVGGYVVEGHVPADVIQRLLRERPPVRGIAVPGMPAGAPGMEGPAPEPYAVLTFDHLGRTAVYDRR